MMSSGDIKFSPQALEAPRCAGRKLWYQTPGFRDGLCEKCGLMLGYLWDPNQHYPLKVELNASIPHYEQLLGVHEAAKAGCPICRCLWRSITKKRAEDYDPKVDPRRTTFAHLGCTMQHRRGCYELLIIIATMYSDLERENIFPTQIEKFLIIPTAGMLCVNTNSELFY